MYRIAICDDTQHLHSLRHQASVCLKEHSATIFSYVSGKEFLEGEKNGKASTDIAVVQVGLRDIDGVELVRQLQLYSPHCQVIFVSDDLSDATEVYAVDHVWFVLTQQLAEKLPAAIERAIEKCDALRSSVLSIRVKGSAIAILCRDILYCERRNRKVEIRCATRSYTTSEGLDDIDARLGREFVRCHYSYIVNMDKIDTLKRTCAILQTGAEIPISRSCLDMTRRAYADYRGRG